MKFSGTKKIRGLRTSIHIAFLLICGNFENAKLEWFFNLFFFFNIFFFLFMLANREIIQQLHASSIESIS